MSGDARRPDDSNAELLEQLRKATQIDLDPKVLDQLRKATQIDPKVLDQLRKATQIDPKVLDQLRKALANLIAPTKKLVPEQPFDEEDPPFEDQEEIVSDDEVPDAIRQLQSILSDAGRDCTVNRRSLGGGDDVNVELKFDLLAGREEREVVVDADGAADLLADEHFLDWRSLTHYNGIWNHATSTIEVEVRVPRLFPTRMMLRGLLGHPGTEEAEPLVIDDPSAKRRLLLGDAHGTAAAVLTNPAARRRHRAPLTIRCEGYEISTTEDAEELIERVTDAFFFDLEINGRASLVLARLESRPPLDRRRTRKPKDPSFPESQYPHAPLVLYRLGRDRSLPPVIRYWALYQVLEYFFSRYADLDALRRLQRHVRSPLFDPHQDEDLVKAISIVGRSANLRERESLVTTLEAVTSADEVRAVIDDFDIGEVLRKLGRELSKEAVNPESDDLIKQLALRIYDIRNRIVHSKDTGISDSGPGVLAGTPDDDLVARELPLLDYLAQQALVASAGPLR